MAVGLGGELSHFSSAELAAQFSTANREVARDASGLEVDLVSGSGTAVMLTEIKSGATIAGDFTSSLDRLSMVLAKRDAKLAVRRRVVYGGVTRQSRGTTEFIPWNEIDQ